MKPRPCEPIISEHSGPRLLVQMPGPWGPKWIWWDACFLAGSMQGVDRCLQDVQIKRATKACANVIAEVTTNI